MHIFDTDIALESQTPGEFKGNVTGNWSINGIPNGGYLLAMAADGMLRSSDKKATPILTVNYLSRCAPGPASFSVEMISQSKNFNRLQIRLIQEGQERLRALGTFVAESDECFLIRYESPPPPVADPARCIAIPQMPLYTLYDQMEVRIDPTCAEWMQGKLSNRSEQKGWIRFKDERSFNLPAVVLAADAFPPAVLASQGLIAWVPTIELSVNVRKIPESKWLKCIFRTRFINCGLLEEDGEIWDADNQLVAVSRQIAQFRSIAK